MSYCKSCGSNVPDGMDTCPKCGASVSGESGAKRITLRCKECNGTMKVNEKSNTMTCMYCGSSELILDSDAVAVEKIRTDAEKEIELKKLQHEEKMENKKDANEYKKTKLFKWSVAVAVIFMIYAAATFASGSVLAGIVGLIPVGVLAYSILLGLGVIDNKGKHNMHVALAIVGFILIIPVLYINSSITSSSHKKDYSNLVWPKSEIAKAIPEITKKKGEINWDSSDSLSLDVYDISQKEFDSYVDKCSEAGFDVDYNRSSGSYSARNQDDLQLMILYYTSSKEMSVSVNRISEVPSVVEELIKDADIVDADVEVTTVEETEVDETEVSTEEETAISEQESSESASNQPSGLNPELKAYLDSYEEFMDEYIEFMEKYEKSNNDIAMLADYTKIMAKYADFAKKIDEYDEDEMSKEDWDYYVEVTTRVNSKLLKAAY